MCMYSVNDLQDECLLNQQCRAFVFDFRLGGALTAQCIPAHF